MPTIPDQVRNRIAHLGRLSGPLDDGRAAALGRAVAETVAKQLRQARDPTAAIGIFEARIQIEASKALNKNPQNGSCKSKPKLADVLQKFAENTICNGY